MSSRSLWYIVTPVYKPAPGGGAICADVVARALAEDGADVVIESEAFPGQPATETLVAAPGSATLKRLYPLRAGRAERDWRSYLAYSVQNLIMLGLPGRLARTIRERQPSKVTVLIHSSLFYHRTVLPAVLDKLRRLHPRIRLVIDVRDPLFDERLAPIFSRFDEAIGCSELIVKKLRAMLPEQQKVTMIPVPFERPELPGEQDIATILARHRLTGVPYVLNPNGIYEPKEYSRLLAVVRAMRARPGYERTVLVTIGRSRDWSARDDAAEKEGLLRYLGIVDNQDALALIGGALGTIILSRIEGVPRSGLETLSLGKPLLAPAVNEFIDNIPSSVLRSDDPDELASQMIELIERPLDEHYPLENHRVANTIHLYRGLEPLEDPSTNPCDGGSAQRSDRRSLWYILTPVYKPAPGGGAIYTDILARALASDGADVVVETEAFPGEPGEEAWSSGQGSITLNRLYPLRAGRAARDWRSYLAYSVQNLKMLGMPGRLARAVNKRAYDDVIVLVHSSLLYNHGVLPHVMGQLRRAQPTAKFVVDVRDPKFDEELRPVLSRFDAAIGCSEAIATKLRALLPERVRVMTIPIPFERPIIPTEAEVARVLAKYELQGIPYLLNPNGVTVAKRYPEILEVVRALRAKLGYERVCLVTIGRRRDWAKRDDEAIEEGVLRYVGVVNNRDALALASAAQATIILSQIEGIPRSGLETLAIGKPLLGPPISEFAAAIPSSVVTSDDPEEIAEQAITLLTKEIDERYPLDRHEMTNLVHLYRSLERA